MNNFWNGFEKRSGIGFAAGLHVLQNALTKATMKSSGFAKSLGHEFTQGLAGKQMSGVSSFGRGLVSGAVGPDLSMLRNNARELGQAAAHEIGKISDPRILVTLRKLSKGQLLDKKGKSLFDLNNPIHSKALALFNRLTGGQVQGHHLANPETAKQLVSTIKSNSITNNILPGLTRAATSAKDVTTSSGKDLIRSGTQAAGAAVGGAGLVAMDPVTGGYNAAKSLMTNPTVRTTLSKSNLGNKTINKFDSMLYKNPIKGSHTKGLSGAKPTPSLLKNTRDIAFNPVTSEAMSLAERAGHHTQVANRPTAHFFPAQPMAKAASVNNFWKGFEKRAWELPAVQDDMQYDNYPNAETHFFDMKKPASKMDTRFNVIPETPTENDVFGWAVGG